MLSRCSRNCHWNSYSAFQGTLVGSAPVTKDHFQVQLPAKRAFSLISGSQEKAPSPLSERSESFPGCCPAMVLSFPTTTPPHFRAGGEAWQRGSLACSETFHGSPQPTGKIQITEPAIRALAWPSSQLFWEVLDGVLRQAAFRGWRCPALPSRRHMPYVDTQLRRRGNLRVGLTVSVRSR